MRESNLQCRFKLEEAKFFYKQMKMNFQKRTIFPYFLDAFLGTARSITHVFQADFKDNKSLMDWYGNNLDELEKFVSKAESMDKKERMSRERK